MVNKVFLLGHLGQDPEVRQTGGGTAVANLRLATNERRKDGDEWKEHTEWHNVVCFGRTAENVGRFLKRGSQCHVEGSLQTRKWQDKDGNDRYSTEVKAHNVRFLGGNGGNSGATDYGGKNSAKPPEDDIPF